MSKTSHPARFSPASGNDPFLLHLNMQNDFFCAFSSCALFILYKNPVVFL